MRTTSASSINRLKFHRIFVILVLFERCCHVNTNMRKKFLGIESVVYVLGPLKCLTLISVFSI